MQDVIFELSTLDRYSVVVAVCFVVAAYAMIKEIVGSTALAVISAPVMMIGALAANYLFRSNFYMAVEDKDTNVVIASAVGVLIALILLLVSIWISVMMSEHRQKNRKPMQLPELPPASE